MIERTFKSLSAMLGTPVFWAFVVGVLIGALLLNVLSGNRFDPGMAYSNFLQNWVQVCALAVTSVASVATTAAVASLHEKHDDLHEKFDRAGGAVETGERAE